LKAPVIRRDRTATGFLKRAKAKSWFSLNISRCLSIGVPKISQIFLLEKKGAPDDIVMQKLDRSLT
jgi:hypothetical protein